MAAIGLADLGPSCCAGWFWWFGGAKKVITCQNNHAIHFCHISSPNQLFIHHDHEHKDIYWHFTSLLYLAMTCWFLRFLCWLRSRLAKQARGTYLYMVLGLFDFNLLCFFTLITSARVAIQHVIHILQLVVTIVFQDPSCWDGDFTEALCCDKTFGPRGAFFDAFQQDLRVQHHSAFAPFSVLEDFQWFSHFRRQELGQTYTYGWYYTFEVSHTTYPTLSRPTQTIDEPPKPKNLYHNGERASWSRQKIVVKWCIKYKVKYVKKNTWYSL